MSPARKARILSWQARCMHEKSWQDELDKAPFCFSSSAWVRVHASKSSVVVTTGGHDTLTLKGKRSQPLYDLGDRIYVNPNMVRGGASFPFFLLFPACSIK